MLLVPIDTRILLLFMFMGFSFVQPVSADSFEGWQMKQRPMIAIAEEKKELMRIDGKSKKVFEFGSKKAVLDKDGAWRLEGTVKHNRLRCADYRVGIQFGRGDEKCSSPKWLADIFYGVEQRHCNNAERPYFSSGESEMLRANYDGYNCAKLLVECAGNCK